MPLQFKKIPYTSEELHEIFQYNDGILSWKINKSGISKSTAGSLESTGYVSIGYKRVRYKAHRIVWKMFNNTDPQEQLDHINGNRSDNRIENLREVTTRSNALNQRKPCNNTSGTVGVHKKNSLWVAHISSPKGKIILGRFPSLDDAIAARKAAETEYGYHPNHGT